MFIRVLTNVNMHGIYFSTIHKVKVKNFQKEKKIKSYEKNYVGLQLSLAKVGIKNPDKKQNIDSDTDCQNGACTSYMRLLYIDFYPKL